MDFAGPASTLEITETEDIILFRVIPRKRWIDILTLIIVFAFCISEAALKFGPVFGVLAALGLGLWLLWQWNTGTPQSLMVTQYELVSSRNGTRRWNRIYGITHVHGGKHNPSGLYTQEPFNGDCLLELDEDQTFEVIKAIYAKFPYPVLMPEPPSPFDRLAASIPILGGESRLITLNLSKPEDPKV